MALPSANVQRQDGGLGIAPARIGAANLVLGVCSKQTAGSLQGFGSKNAVTGALGGGPLVEAIISRLIASGGPVYAVVLPPSVAGSVGAVTHAGSGAGTVTPSLAPDREILAKVTTGGTLGNAQIAFSVDGSAYGTPQATSGAPWVHSPAGAPLVSLSFPAGTYVLNEVYTFAKDGAVSQSGAGPLPTKTASPVDGWTVMVEILTAGALGVATFRYTLEGQVEKPLDTASWSGEIVVPAGGKFVIPGTGIVLTFASTFVKGDTYAFTSVPAGYSTGEVSTALDTAHADQSVWRFIQVVGSPANAAAAASLAGTLKTKLTEMYGEFRYTRAVMECPQGEGDATIKTAFASFDSEMVSPCVGDVDMRSPGGIRQKRNCAWAACNQMAKSELHEAPEKVALGALDFVDRAYRLENDTPGLHDARFITVRTHIGKAGFFITGGKTMAQNGSDFSSTERMDVINEACRVVRAEALELLSSDLDVDEDGKISEVQAQKSEQRMQAVLRTALQKHISRDKNGPAGYVVIDRDANILSTEELPITVSVVPKGKASTITAKVGFANPALT